MSADTHREPILPPGPETPFTPDTNEATFAAIPQWLAAHGDVVRLSAEGRRHDSYLLNDADAIRHVLVKNHANYRKGPGFNRVKMLLGNGIIVSDGAFWRRQRRLIQPAFNRKVLARMLRFVQQANAARRERWQALADAGAVIDVTTEAADLSLEVILRTLFGEDFDRLTDQQGGNPFAFLTEDLTRDMQVVLRFRGLMKLMQDLIHWRRETRPERDDFLAMFLDARDRDTGEAMSDKELIDELMTFIIAGHETSAITLNWTWYFLARHPEEAERARAEILSVTGGAMPGYEQLGRFERIRRVVSEALRLYPPVWLFSRTAIGDDRIGDYAIPAGTDLFISPYYLHRHPAHWPDAEAFDPDRFAPEAEKARHPTAYIPFSAGPRRCIGDVFAMLEMQLHFGLMLPRFSLEYRDEQPLELEPFINLRTRHNLRYRITPV